MVNSIDLTVIWQEKEDKAKVITLFVLCGICVHCFSNFYTKTPTTRMMDIVVVLVTKQEKNRNLFWYLLFHVKTSFRFVKINREILKSEELTTSHIKVQKLRYKSWCVYLFIYWLKMKIKASYKLWRNINCWLWAKWSKAHASHDLFKAVFIGLVPHRMALCDEMFTGIVWWKIGYLWLERFIRLGDIIL